MPARHRKTAEAAIDEAKAVIDGSGPGVAGLQQAQVLPNFNSSPEIARADAPTAGNAIACATCGSRTRAAPKPGEVS
jgi:hypothetical protein